jgi:hypothetical protein
LISQLLRKKLFEQPKTELTMMLEALSDKEAVDLQSLSKESEDESQFTAKYEAQM